MTFKQASKILSLLGLLAFIPCFRKQNSRKSFIARSILALFFAVSASCTLAASKLDLCPTGAVVQSKDGIRRLALIVGVGEYKSEDIKDLAGPSSDAKRFYDLLTSPKGYGFPKENVCVLLDGQATTANFKQYFTDILVNRAGAKDEAVFYYAGHGSQVADTNKDEPDSMDETFVLHDARSDGVKEFVDDEFDGLLKTLYDKTHQITVFLDSCNSGTALRGDEVFVSRFLPPQARSKTEKRSASDSSPTKDSSGMVTSSMPGIIAFTAASDGTSALEKNGHGIFTDAVLTALGQISAKQLTYAQAARQILPLVKAESYQIPYFQGDLQRGVFSDSIRTQPLSWDVKEVKANLIKLSGVPLPGIGKNAEFRVYDGSITGADSQDPTKIKALVGIDKTDGLNADAHIISRPKDAEAIKPGDIAVLARPGDEQTLLKVTLRPKSQHGGIPPKKAANLAVSLGKHPDAKKVVSIVKNKGDYELSLDDKGNYVVKGPENIVRNSMASEDEVIKNLWQHSKQRVFSTLRGEGGSLFVDQETLQVQIVPAKDQKDCDKDIEWHQEPMNSGVSQRIPLCYRWNVKVKFSDTAKADARLLVGGLVLSTDGEIFGFPTDQKMIPLSPGEEIVFAASNDTFKASPPLNVDDQIIVFGTQETNPVPWGKLTDLSTTRSGDVKNGLYRTLDRYVSGTRGQGKANEPEVATDTAWTLSSMTMRVYEPKK
jgi:hypothetical protein